MCGFAGERYIVHTIINSPNSCAGADVEAVLDIFCRCEIELAV